MGSPGGVVNSAAPHCTTAAAGPPALTACLIVAHRLTGTRRISPALLTLLEYRFRRSTHMHRLLKTLVVTLLVAAALMLAVPAQAQVVIVQSPPFAPAPPI